MRIFDNIVLIYYLYIYKNTCNLYFIKINLYRFISKIEIYQKNNFILNI